MSRRCPLNSKKKTMSGNLVSHSNRKTKRTFRPNLQTVSLWSDSLKRSVSVRIAVSSLRTVDAKGGLDSFLLTARSCLLSDAMRRIQKQVKRVVETSTVA